LSDGVYDVYDTYTTVMRSIGITDAQIRALIKRADEQGVNPIGRVLRLPARIGQLYGCDVVLDATIRQPQIEATRKVIVN
jgi:hypothetical protein